MSRQTRWLIAACAVAAAVAFGITWWWRATPPQGSPPLAAALALSPEQRQRIEQLDPRYRHEVAVLAERLHHERQTLAEWLEDADATDIQILEQVEQVIAAHNTLERRVAEHLVAMRHELEPQQRQRLGRYTAGQVRRGMGQRWADGRGRGMGQGQGQGRFDEDRPRRHQRWEDNDVPRGGPGPGPGAGPAMDASYRDIIDFLFAHHQHIERQVQDLPDGVLTTTTSDDPRVTEALRRHVRQMKDRLTAGHPMRRGDPLFRELFANHARIDMRIEDIPGGVRVRQTSDDEQVVLLIRQHAHAAVSQFVEFGPEREHRFTPLPEGYHRP